MIAVTNDTKMKGHKLFSHNAGIMWPKWPFVLVSALTSAPSRPCDGGLEKRELDPKQDLTSPGGGAVRLYWGRIGVWFWEESDDGRVWDGFQRHLSAGGPSDSPPAWDQGQGLPRHHPGQFSNILLFNIIYFLILFSPQEGETFCIEGRLQCCRRGDKQDD